MPTNTYIALANITVTGTPSSITIGSIPGTYRDLVIIANLRTSRSATGSDTTVRLNSDSGTNYPRVGMYGTGSSSGSFTSTSDTGLYLQATGNSASAGIYDYNIVQIMDYSATDKHKTALLRCSENAITTTLAIAQRWSNTAAVTSLTFVPQSGFTYVSGVTISIYGIAS